MKRDIGWPTVGLGLVLLVLVVVLVVSVVQR